MLRNSKLQFISLLESNIKLVNISFILIKSLFIDKLNIEMIN